MEKDEISTSTDIGVHRAPLDLIKDVIRDFPVRLWKSGDTIGVNVDLARYGAPSCSTISWYWEGSYETGKASDDEVADAYLQLSEAASMAEFTANLKAEAEEA